MKITFVYPDVQVGVPWWKGYFYTGVASLAAQLKRAGHETGLVHITQPDYGREDFLRDFSDAKPDVLAFSATTLAFPWVMRSLRWLKEEGIKVHTICGGAHPPVDAEHAVQIEGLDAICLGEGEGAMLDFVSAVQQGKPYREIQNLWVRDEDGTIHRNPLRPLIQDLDTLAPYDRTDWRNFAELHWEREGEAVTVASRGCPYKCTYCVNHYYMELFPDKQYVRFRSVDNTIAELKDIVNTYPYIKGFVFDDDILYMRKPWSIEFTEKYKKELGLPFTCNIRPNICKPDIVALLKEANCRTVKVGLEAGNEYIRNTLLKRDLKASDMITAFLRFEKVGIETISFNMVGLPFETPQTVLETVKLNGESHVSKAQVSIFYPFPGTELQRLCEENGFVRPFREDIYDYFSDSSLNMDTLTREQIIAYRVSFQVFMKLYGALYRMSPEKRKVPEKILDTIFTSKYFPFISKYGIQPLRQTYRYFIRPALQKVLNARGGRQELASAPVLEGHDV